MLKYTLLAIVLSSIFIWFFNSFIGWGVNGSILGIGLGSGLVIAYLSDKLKKVSEKNGGKQEDSAQ